MAAAPAGPDVASSVAVTEQDGLTWSSWATAVAAVRSVLTYAGLSLYVTLVAPPGMLVAIVFKSKALLHILGHVGVRLGLLLSGISYRVAGRENVPRGGAVVFCANHQSNIDPPVLFDALHSRLHVLYKAELSKLPLFGRAIQLGGFIPIERQNREQAVAAIAKGAASIRAGNSFLIFPEGTRVGVGEVRKYGVSGSLLASRAGCKIVPVAHNAGKFFTPGSTNAFFTTTSDCGFRNALKSSP